MKTMSWASLPRVANKRDFLVKYTPPTWALELKYVPKYRVKLAQLPTPVLRWELPDIPDGYQIYIKRDDLTGSTLTGNKIRKLEFLFADAIDKGCTDVIATGDMQSNYCRATTVAARQLGLKPHLVIKSKLQNISELPCTANMLINQMCDASIYLSDDPVTYGDKVKAKMQEVADDIRNKAGKIPYIMPRGGSCIEGVYGYIEAFSELIQQGIEDNITDIVLASGSAGSISGLAIANYLACGSAIRIHGFGITSFSDDYTYGYLKKELSLLGITDVNERELIYFHHQYLGEGYGYASDQQKEFMVKVSSQTGIILDPTYTGKAAFGMASELQKSPSNFKGKKILFIHTGGLFGLMDGKMGDFIKTNSLIKHSSEK